MSGFDLLFGNENLKNFITRPGASPHAVLIEGKEGSGKSLAALLTACALSCEAENKPCLDCPACRKILSGGTPDVQTVSVESGKKFISVDSIRRVRTDANNAPVELPVRVYIIERADKMNIPAQNAFLKVLEEPPAHARFILKAESSAPLLPTVISRCTLFRAENVSASGFGELCEWYAGVYSSYPASLLSSLYSLSAPKLKTLSTSLAGSVKRTGTVGEIFEAALSAGVKKDELTAGFIDAFSKTGYTTLLSLKKLMPKKREDYAGFIKNSIYAVRDLMAVKKTGGEELLYYRDRDECANISKVISFGNLLRLEKALLECESEIAANCNVALSQTKLLINAYRAKNPGA